VKKAIALFFTGMASAICGTAGVFLVFWMLISDAAKTELLRGRASILFLFLLDPRSAMGTIWSMIALMVLAIFFGWVFTAIAPVPRSDDPPKNKEEDAKRKDTYRKFTVSNANAEPYSN